MALQKMKTSTLFQLGTLALALRGVLWIILRNSRSSDAVDFAQGFLIAVGSILLLMVAWRRGRHYRGQPGPTAS